MSNPFVFIVGCPRSGTTLLKRMIDSHPDVAVMSEIGWLARRYEKRLSLTPDGLVAPEFIYELLETETFGRYEPVPLCCEELEEVLETREAISYADFVARVFDRYGELCGKKLVGNKTVILVRSIATLHELWLHAKFVHLVRDGRDVARSATEWRRAENLARDFPIWREDPISTAAAWWEWHLRPALDDGSELGPELYYEIRYESLVARPDDEMGRLCAFLDIRCDDAMLRFHEGDTRRVRRGREAQVAASNPRAQRLAQGHARRRRRALRGSGRRSSRRARLSPRRPRPDEGPPRGRGARAQGFRGRRRQLSCYSPGTARCRVAAHNECRARLGS